MPESRAYADLAFDRTLDEVDPFIADLTRREHARQHEKLILIPSESLTPRPVREALASPFTSIYAEGYPAGPMLRDEESALQDVAWQLARFRRYGDRRYYRGNDFSNLVESLARRRCAQLFGNQRAPAQSLHVNVQPLSGAAANNAVYEALLEPEDTIMGLALAHGGHLSHGARVNRSGRRFRSVSYRIAAPDAKLDYDEIAATARRDRPRIIVAGYTSYPWAPDWERFRAIADSVDAYLLADISHPAGLVVAGAYPSPVGIADVVTFTTHKTLFGPRAAVILSHRETVMRRIHRAVFPGEQGGPHLNKIAAMAVAFRLAATAEFQAVQRQIVANAAALARALDDEGVGLAYGGTDTHKLVVNLKTAGAVGDLRGEPAVRILDLVGIVTNRNSLPGDRGFAAPSGVRMGTPWLTQRGYLERDMADLAVLLARTFRASTGLTYPGRRGPRHRGRIDYAELRRLQADVRDFAARGRSEGVVAPPALATRVGLLELRGPRVAAFVDEICNRRTRDLPAGLAQHVAIGAVPGEPPVSALVFRPEDDRAGRDRRFWLLVDPERGPELATWLQAVADGYVVIDPREPSRKLTGPVAVTPGPECAEPLQAWPITASDAARLTGQNGEPSARVKLNGHSVWVLAEGEAAAIVAPADGRVEIERALAERDVAEASLPLAPAPDLRRPYFLGRAEHLPEPDAAEANDFEWSEPEDVPLRETPLHDFHARHAKKLVPFAGWDMPVWYRGIEAEHQTVRTAAGLFDVGHMGVFSVGGAHAAEFLDLTLTANASRLPVGRAAYTYLLDPTGHCLDDLIIYRVEAERFLVVVNAANAEKDWAWLRAVNERTHPIEPGDRLAQSPVRVELLDLKDPAAGDGRRLDLALQGRHSRASLMRLAADDTERGSLRAMHANDIVHVTLAGVPVEIARTGYTGERLGFEIFVHPEASRQVWDAILETGADDGVTACGLGARDSTRTEAGFPLYGHELGGPHDLTPGDAGFGSFVKAYKPYFIGRDGFMRREAKRRAQIVRFAVTDERAPMARESDPVVDARGSWIGVVTSAALDTHGRQVGMAYLDSRHAAERTPLRVFAGVAARSAMRALSPSELASGGRYPLPVNAIVLPRFRT